MVQWCLKDVTLDLSAFPVVGILNVTPDSFSDGGRFTSPDQAAASAAEMLKAGAAAIDIGGESTRPGAHRIHPDEQIARIIPAIRLIRSQGFHQPILVDTTSSVVAQAAILAGANGVNDVSAGTDDPSMFETVRQLEAGIVLMHRLVEPIADRFSDEYHRPPIESDVVPLVDSWLSNRIALAKSAGIRAESIVIDPGLGFGKSVQQNLELIRGTATFLKHGHGVMSALSRKSFVGRLSLERDSAPNERLMGTVALTVAHALAGARLFRVHDVEPLIQALRSIRGLISDRSS